MQDLAAPGVAPTARTQRQSDGSSSASGAPACAQPLSPRGLPYALGTLGVRPPPLGLSSGTLCPTSPVSPSSVFTPVSRASI